MECTGETPATTARVSRATSSGATCSVRNWRRRPFKCYAVKFTNGRKLLLRRRESLSFPSSAPALQQGGFEELADLDFFTAGSANPAT